MGYGLYDECCPGTSTGMTDDLNRMNYHNASYAKDCLAADVYTGEPPSLYHDTSDVDSNFSDDSKNADDCDVMYPRYLLMMM